MQPALAIDFGKASFHRFYQLFLPFLPGGTLVVGLILAHPDFFRMMMVALGLGNYSRLGAIAFGSYAVGLLLYGFSCSVTSLFQRVGFALLIKWFPPKRENMELSRRPAWRRAAASVLGPTITPRWPVADLGTGEDPSAALLGVSDDRWDVEWNDWYNGLQDYFYGAEFPLPVDLQLLWSHLQATSWAMLFVYFNTPLRGHWSVLLVVFTVIAYGLVFRLFPAYEYWKSDRLVYWQFLGKLLVDARRHRTGEESESNPPQAAEA